MVAGSAISRIAAGGPANAAAKHLPRLADAAAVRAHAAGAVTRAETELAGAAARAGSAATVHIGLGTVFHAIQAGRRLARSPAADAACAALGAHPAVSRIISRVHADTVAIGPSGWATGAAAAVVACAVRILQAGGAAPAGGAKAASTVDVRLSSVLDTVAATVRADAAAAKRARAVGMREARAAVRARRAIAPAAVHVRFVEILHAIDAMRDADAARTGLTDPTDSPRVDQRRDGQAYAGIRDLAARCAGA
jgi:hypothetical protein